MSRKPTKQHPGSTHTHTYSMGHIPALLASSRPTSRSVARCPPSPPISSVDLTSLFTPTMILPHTFFVGTLASAFLLKKCRNAELKTQYDAGDQLLLTIAMCCINNENKSISNIYIFPSVILNRFSKHGTGQNESLAKKFEHIVCKHPKDNSAKFNCVS